MSQQYTGVDPFLPGSDDSTDFVRSHAGRGSFGASLSALREARGWTVADVSARLKFGVRQIEALEADRWEDLPQGLPLRGLIRNYARLLDVAPETLMSALPEHLQHQNVPVGNLTPVGALPHSTLPRWSADGRRRRSWPMVVLVLFLLCALALAAYLVFAWWLPRNAATNTSEVTGFPMVDGSESSLAINPLSSGQASAMVGTTPAAPAGSANTASGAVQAPGGGNQTVAVPGPASGSPAPGATTGAAASLPQTTIAPGVSIPGVATPGVVTPGVATPGSATAGVAGGVSGQVPAAGAAVPAVAGSATGGTPLSAPADPAAPAPSVVGNQLQFNVTAASWVEVRDASGSVVLSSTLQPGATPQVDATPPVRVVIGNAKGVSLNWQGEAVDLGPHQRGNVARLTLE